MFFLLIENEYKRLKTERLYYTYRQLMYSEAYAVLNDEQLAEDAVSESFVRIFKNLHKIDEKNVAATKSFLTIVCRNVAIDIYNSRTHLNRYETEHEKVSADDKQLHCDPSDIVIGKEQLRALTRAIESLDPIYRDVFLLRRVHGYSREEIAKTLGISVETVKKRLTRAKAMLIKYLEKEEAKNAE